MPKGKEKITKQDVPEDLIKFKKKGKLKENVPFDKRYKSYSTDQGMMVPGSDTKGQFVGYSLKRPKDQTKKHASGGLAMRGYGKAYMKGGKVK